MADFDASTAPTPATPSGNEPLLTVTDLNIGFTTQDGTVDAVRGVSFTIEPGRTLAIVGESGSGKSTTAAAVIGLLAENGKVTSGSIKFDGDELVGMAESGLRRVRGNSIGMVPQDPMSNLNPVTRIGQQVAEPLLAHGHATKKNVGEKVEAILELAGLPNAKEHVKQYPHELSGGMRQRVLIAIGLACRPKLLIADEPTSALDVSVQRVILDQISRMTEELGTAVMLITHDLGLAAERAQDIIVMNKGEVVEAGPARQILENPQAEYTKKLVAAAPSIAAARMTPNVHVEDVPPLPGDEHVGEGRTEAGDTPSNITAETKAPALIASVKNLSKVFKGGFGKPDFQAVKGVSIEVPRGKTTAIVGESGSGKTTTARMLLKLIDPTSGDITFEGTAVQKLDRAQLRDFRQRVQPIFQDPYSSLNPMFTIEKIVSEPLRAYKRGNNKLRRRRVAELLEEVALDPKMLSRYPSELSGGQRQRVAIARALALDPELIVCDEPVSALDVLVQDQILKLLDRLQRENGLSYVFISHDLAVVRLISDYVHVMKDGEVVESGTTEEIFENPQHPYTVKLLASIPGVDIELGSAS